MHLHLEDYVTGSMYALYLTTDFTVCIGASLKSSYVKDLLVEMGICIPNL